MAKFYLSPNIRTKLKKITDFAEQLATVSGNVIETGFRKSDLIKLNSLNTKITKEVVWLTEEAEKMDTKE